MSDEPLLKEKQQTTTSLLFRNLIFTVLQPGVVAGLVPYYLVGNNKENLFETPWRAHVYAGLIVISIGIVVTLRCILQFAVEGKGTLSPLDPTKRLVVKGLYRFSRNPMYVGVMTILIGEAILMQSVLLWIYLATIFIGFNLFILFHEEPRLRKDFGAEYVRYCRKVRRWI